MNIPVLLFLFKKIYCYMNSDIWCEAFICVYLNDAKITGLLIVALPGFCEQITWILALKLPVRKNVTKITDSHSTAACYKCGPFGSSFLSYTFGYCQPCVFRCEGWGYCVVAAEQFSQANSGPCWKYFTPNVSLVSEVLWVLVCALVYFLSSTIFCFPSLSELLSNTYLNHRHLLNSCSTA